MKDFPNPNEWFEQIDEIKRISIVELRKKLRFVADNERAFPIVGVVVFKECRPGEPLSHRSYMTNSEQENLAKKNRDDSLLAWRLDGGENGVDIWANITGTVRSWQNECPEGDVELRRESSRVANCEKWDVDFCYVPTQNHKMVKMSDTFPSNLFERTADDDFEIGPSHRCSALPAYDFASSFDSCSERLSVDVWKHRMKAAANIDPMLGIVVFSAEEYKDGVSLEGRSVVCRSDSPYFTGEGSELRGDSLDGLDTDMIMEVMLDGGGEEEKPMTVDYCYIPTRGGIPISSSDPAYELLQKTPVKKGLKWQLKEQNALIASQRMTISALVKKIEEIERN